MRSIYEENKMLGYIIDENGRILEPTRYSAIKEMPTPKNFNTLPAFLGLT